MSGASDGVEYEIQLTSLALEMLAKVKDRREQEKLAERIDRLKVEPEKQGKALVDNHQGFAVFEQLGNAIASSIRLSKSKFLF